jgi:hypothetical protein
MVGVVLLRTRNLPGDENVAYWGLTARRLILGLLKIVPQYRPLWSFPMIHVESIGYYVEKQTPYI